MNTTAFNDSDDDIVNFVSACNDAISGSVILAEKKFADILRSIASSERLIRQFKDALRGYDRVEEFKRAEDKVGGRGKLTPPQSQVKLMAFVFCLLMDIDSGKRSLREFLDAYFYHANHAEAYNLFTSALIAPFRDATEFIFYNGVDGDDGDDGVDITLRESVKRLLQEMNGIVNLSTSITAKTKQDLFALARGIESALTPNRIDLVKPLLIGYKNTVVSYPIRDKLSPYIDKLYKILTTAEVI